MIRLENVSKHFSIGKVQRPTLVSRIISVVNPAKGNIWALRNIRLEIKHGECVAIIGPNGSGKSTLLSIIAGILVQNSGVFENDEEVTPLLMLGIGFLLDLTAKDNIYLYGAILGKDRRYIRKRFRAILHFAELEKFENTKLKDFSSGMLSRLAFSIAIHTDPKTLLIDEVLAVGDREFNKKCFKVISKFKSEGKGIIFVSHDLELIRKFFPRCIYIRDGRIVADGKSADVIRRYEKDGTR